MNRSLKFPWVAHTNLAQVVRDWSCKPAMISCIRSGPLDVTFLLLFNLLDTIMPFLPTLYKLWKTRLAPFVAYWYLDGGLQSHLSGCICLFWPNILGRCWGLTNDILSASECSLSCCTLLGGGETQTLTVVIEFVEVFTLIGGLDAKTLLSWPLVLALLAPQRATQRNSHYLIFIYFLSSLNIPGISFHPTIVPKMSSLDPPEMNMQKKTIQWKSFQNLRTMRTILGR